MSWSRRILGPGHQRDGARTVGQASPPLMRFLGSIGFAAVGIGVVHLGIRVLDLSPDFWYADRWDGRAVGLLLTSILLAAVGGVTGLWIGASIRIRSENVNHVINILWNCVANGSLIWTMVMMMTMQKAWGREGLIAYVRSADEGAFLTWLLLPEVVGGLVIGALWALAGVVPLGGRLMGLPCLVLTAPVSAGMGYAASKGFGIASHHCVVASVLFALALVPVCAYMIHRDQVQRKQMLEM